MMHLEELRALPQIAQMQGPYAKICGHVNARAMRSGRVCAHQSEGTTVIIPPQLRATQASRQETQSYGDSGGNHADGGNDDDDRLTAIQTIDVG